MHLPTTWPTHDVLLALGLMLLCCSVQAAEAGDRPLGSMRTRWAALANPDAPLPEYPRPAVMRDAWVNLNGRWDYAIAPRTAEHPTTWDGKIVVPFCAESQLSGVQRFVGAENRLWYRRTFAAAPPKEGERVLLHFGAVDWEARVWVNGRELGTHRGGYDPFTFDITDALKENDNELVVSVWDPTDTGPQPRGKQVNEPRGIWYTAVSGIWQTVWLETVPAYHLTGFRAEGDPASGQLTVQAETAGTPTGEEMTVDVLDGDAVVASGDTDTPSDLFTLRIPEPKAWSPSDPHLYSLRVRMGSDEVLSYCALRGVSWKADEHGVNRLFLNGKQIFHFGPLDQGWWPDGLYTAPTDEALRYDIEMTRAMGFNMARKHVKVESERWYYWADRLGLMVWQDMPSGFITGRPKGEPNADHENFRRELEAVMDAFDHHPCIVAWVPYNEGWGQPDEKGTNETLKWTKESDPARLVGAASGWTDHGWGDWKDKHQYPGPAMFAPMEGRVSVLGEFGGLGLPVEGHLWWDKRNWGYRTYRSAQELTSNYHGLIKRLARLIPRGLAAAVYTQTTDCEGEVNGLMTYDRVPKMDVVSLKDLHAALYEPAVPAIMTALSDTSEDVRQPWRYSFNEPGDGWEQPDFDDSSWPRGAGGFGTEETPGAHVGTEWDGNEIWLRRTFEAAELPPDAELLLRIHHDEDAVVYLNGTEIANLPGYTVGYIEVPITGEKATSLKAGDNVIAVSCRQSQGGQFIDAGLCFEVPRPKKVD